MGITPIYSNKITLTVSSSSSSVALTKVGMVSSSWPSIGTVGVAILVTSCLPSLNVQPRCCRATIRSLPVGAGLIGAVSIFLGWEEIKSEEECRVVGRFRVGKVTLIHANRETQTMGVSLRSLKARKQGSFCMNAPLLFLGIHIIRIGVPGVMTLTHIPNHLQRLLNRFYPNIMYSKTCTLPKPNKRACKRIGVDRAIMGYYQQCDKELSNFKSRRRNLKNGLLTNPSQRLFINMRVAKTLKTRKCYFLLFVLHFVFPHYVQPHLSFTKLLLQPLLNPSCRRIFWTGLPRMVSSVARPLPSETMCRPMPTLLLPLNRKYQITWGRSMCLSITEGSVLQHVFIVTDIISISPMLALGLIVLWLSWN